MTTSILEANQGMAERIVRIVVGAGLLSLVFVGPHTLWGLVGVVPLATGLVGSCPMYTLLRGKNKAGASAQQ